MHTLRIYKYLEIILIEKTSSNVITRFLKHVFLLSFSFIKVSSYPLTIHTSNFVGVLTI